MASKIHKLISNQGCISQTEYANLSQGCLTSVVTVMRGSDMALWKRSTKSRSRSEILVSQAIKANPNLAFFLDGIGVVEEDISEGDVGRVKYQSSYWDAISLSGYAIAKGQKVRIVGVRNTTLVVEPISLALTHASQIPNVA